MNILFILPYSPIPMDSGAAIRIYHLIHHLALVHHLEIISFGAEEEGNQLRRHFCHKIRGVHMVPLPGVNNIRRLAQLYSLFFGKSFYSQSTTSNKMKRVIEQTLQRASFDVIQTEFFVMGRYIPDGNAVKVLDEHNIEYDNQRRISLYSRSGLRKFYYRKNYEKMRMEELDVCRNQDVIFCTSDRDKAILDVDIPFVRKLTIPNGVDMRYFFPSERIPEPHSLVFTGAMGYVPNYDGMLYFLDEIFPHIRKQIADAKIYIVGNKPPKALRARAGENIIVTGYVKDVRPYVWRSSVYVVPLRMGGGTRLKVLEAMAMKKPVVATSIGCEGIAVRHGETVFVEDEPIPFAERVVQLLRDAALRETLTGQAYELARIQYDWKIIGEKVEDTYQNILYARTYGKDNRRALSRRFSSPGRSQKKIASATDANIFISNEKNTL